MIKILFIQPYDFPNFQGKNMRKRFFISRAIFEVGYQVPQECDFHVLDLNLAVRQRGTVFRAIQETVADYDPQLIFLTYPSFPQGDQIALVLHCLSMIGDFPVVIGGGAISLIEDAPLRWWPNMNIACCYKGFGNEIPAIIESIVAERQRHIEGVFWVEEESAQKIEPKKSLIDFYRPEDLYSAKNRFNFQSYLVNITKHDFIPCAIVELTRGCLHRCSFCAINKKNLGFFSRSPETVIHEIEYLAKNGIISFRFADPTFGIEKEKLGELLEGMALVKNSFPKIRFEITTRADVVSRERARLFSRAGIWRCDLGMETMSEAELVSVKKDIRKERLQSAVRNLSEANIETKLFHITFPNRISIPTLRFFLELSQEGVPFLVQSAYLRSIPDSQCKPQFHCQDQKVFCRESDSIEQIMEWVLANLAFKSTNTFLHASWLRDMLSNVLWEEFDLRELFEINQSNGGITLKLKDESGEQGYIFHHMQKTPFMWCLKKEV